MRFVRVTAPGRIQAQVPAMALGGRLQIEVPLVVRATESTVTPAGAVVQSADQQAELTVPSGALSLDASIGLTPLSWLPQLPADIGGLARGYAPVYALVAHGEEVQFATPAELRVANLAGLPPGATVPLARFDRDLAAYVTAGSAVVEADGTWLVAAVSRLGLYVFALPGDPGQPMPYRDSFRDETLRRGWGKVSKIGAHLAVADGRLVRQIAIPKAASSTLPPPVLLYDSFVATGRSRLFGRYEALPDVPPPAFSRLEWTATTSAQAVGMAGLSASAVFAPILPPEAGAPAGIDLGYALMSLGHGAVAQLGPASAYGDPLGALFSPMVVSPWALENSQLQSVRIEGARTVRVTGDALPYGHGWMIQGLSQLVPAPDDGARFLYLRDGRAEYTSRVGRVSRIGGEGVAERSLHGLRAREADLSEVRALHVGPADGGAVVAGYGTAGGYVALIAPPGVVWVAAGGGTDTAPDGVPGRKAMLQGPAAVVSAEDGLGQRLYFAEKLGHRVRYVDSVGTVRLLAGYDGIADFAGDGGQASAARLNAPSGLALDVDGSLFVADTGNHVIRRIGTNGIITTIAGTPEQPTDATHLLGDGAAALLATLATPGDLAVEVTATAAGERLLFIADTANCRVRALHLELGPDQGLIETYAGNGTCGSITAGIDAAQSALPTGLRLAVDGAGNLYLSDPGADPGTAKVFRVDRATRQVVAVLGGGPGGEASAHLGVQLGDLGAVGVGPDGSWLVAAAAIAGGHRGLAAGWYADPDAVRSDMVVTWPEAGIRQLTRDGDTERFDALGRLVWALRDELAVTYVYANGRLAALRGVGGEEYTLQYRGDGMLQQIVSPTSKITEFLFDAAGDLVFTGGNENATALFFYDGGHLLLGDKAIDATQYHIEYRGDGIVGRVWYEGLELNATTYDDGSGEAPTLLPPEVYAVGPGAKCESTDDCDIGLLCLGSLCTSPAPPAPDFGEDDGPWLPPGGFGGSPGTCPPENPDQCKWYFGIDGSCYSQPLQKVGCPCSELGQPSAKTCLQCAAAATGADIWQSIAGTQLCKNDFDCQAESGKCGIGCKLGSKSPESCGVCDGPAQTAGPAPCDDACLCSRKGLQGSAIGSLCSEDGEKCSHFSNKICTAALAASGPDVGCFHLEHVKEPATGFYVYRYCRGANCATLESVDGPGARVGIHCSSTTDCYPSDDEPASYYLLECPSMETHNRWIYAGPDTNPSTSIQEKPTCAMLGSYALPLMAKPGGPGTDSVADWTTGLYFDPKMDTTPPKLGSFGPWQTPCPEGDGHKSCLENMVSDDDKVACSSLTGSQQVSCLIAKKVAEVDKSGQEILFRVRPVGSAVAVPYRLVPPPLAAPMLCNWDCATGSDSLSPDRALHCHPQRGCQWPESQPLQGPPYTLAGQVLSEAAPCGPGNPDCQYMHCKAGVTVYPRCQNGKTCAGDGSAVDPGCQASDTGTVSMYSLCSEGTCQTTAQPQPVQVANPEGGFSDVTCGPPGDDQSLLKLWQPGQPGHTCTDNCGLTPGEFPESPGTLTGSVPPGGPPEGPKLNFYIGNTSTDPTAALGSTSNPFRTVYDALTDPVRLKCQEALTHAGIKSYFKSLGQDQLDLIAPVLGNTPPQDTGVIIQLIVRQPTGQDAAATEVPLAPTDTAAGAELPVTGASGGGVLVLSLPGQPSRNVRCMVVVTGENRVDTAIPVPVVRSCYGAAKTTAVQNPADPNSPIYQKMLCPAVKDTWQTPLPWHYPCPARYGDPKKSEDPTAIYPVKNAQETGTLCTPGPDAFATNLAKSSDYGGVPYVEGHVAEAYRPQDCACTADGNTGGALNQDNALEGQAARIRVTRHTIQAPAVFRLNLQGITDVRFRGIDFVLQLTTMLDAELVEPKKIGGDDYAVFHLDGRTAPVQRIAFEGVRLLDVEFSRRYQDMWDSTVNLRTDATLPVHRTGPTFILARGAAEDLKITRSAFCPPMAYLFRHDNDPQTRRFRNHAGRVHFSDNRMAGAIGKTIAIHGVEVRNPNGSDDAGTPACDQDPESGFVFTRNIFEGGLSYPCWGQWGVARLFQMGAVDYLTIGPLPDDPQNVSGAYQRPPICAAVEGVSQNEPLPPWSGAMPEQMWSPAAGPRCNDTATGLLDFAHVLGGGGNVVRRWQRPLAFDVGGTRVAGCSVAWADTPAWSAYGRCARVQNNGFEQTTFVDLSNMLGMRFESNALCGLTGDVDPDEVNKRDALLHLREHLHDASACGNRIDGAFGRVLAGGRFEKGSGQINPPVDDMQRRGIYIAPQNLRTPHDLPAPSQHSIRVVGNAVGGVTVGGLAQHTTTLGPHAPWLSLVHGPQALPKGTSNAAMLGYEYNFSNPHMIATWHTDGVQEILWSHNAVRLRPPQLSSDVTSSRHAASNLSFFSGGFVDVRTGYNRYGVVGPTADNGMCLNPGQPDEERVWPLRVLTQIDNGHAPLCYFAQVDGVINLGQTLAADQACRKPEVGSDHFAAAGSPGDGSMACTSQSISTALAKDDDGVAKESHGNQVCPFGKAQDKAKSYERGRLDPATDATLARCGYMACGDQLPGAGACKPPVLKNGIMPVTDPVLSESGEPVSMPQDVCAIPADKYWCRK